MKKVLIWVIGLASIVSCEHEMFESGTNMLQIDAVFDDVSTRCGKEGPYELIEVGKGIVPMKSEVLPLYDSPDTKGTLVQSQSDFAAQFGTFTLCVFDGTTKVLNTPVTYDENTSSWKLSTDFIWDWGKELEFIAWNDDGRIAVENIIPGEGDSPATIELKCNSLASNTIESTKDAMIGYYKGTGDKGKATLAFTHLYGGISFKLSTLADDFEEGSKIMSITLKDAIDQGSGVVTLGEKRSAEWTVSETCDYTQSFDGGISIPEFNEIAQKFLLPEYDGTMELTMNLPSEGNKTFTTKVASPGIGLCRIFNIKRTGKAILIHGRTEHNSIYIPGFNFYIRQLYTNEEPDNTTHGNSIVKKIVFDVRSSVNSGKELQATGSDFKIRANIAPDDETTVIISTPADIIYLDNANSMFAEMTALERIDNFECLNSKECIGFREMFKDCSSLKELNFGPDFQMTQFLKFDYTIHEYVNSPTNNPVNFFNGCSSLTTINLEYPFANLSNCVDLYGFFAGCTSLGSITMPDSLNTSNVTSMNSMFSRCRKLSDASFLSRFNTSSVTDMSHMFYLVSNDIIGIDLDLSNFDTSNVKTMYAMFYGSNINNLNLSSFTSDELTTVGSMFLGSRVQNIEFGDNFTLENVQSTNGMFQNCFFLQSLDLSHFRPQNLTSCANMFAMTSEYTKQKLVSIDFGSDFKLNAECDVTNALYSYFEYEDTLTIKCNSTTKDLLNKDTSGRNLDHTTFITY